jgi:SOS response regulatory protein OraA/RecX
MTEDYVMELYRKVVDKLMRVGYSQEEAEEATRNAMNENLKDEAKL